jgi:hypothetical protein
MDSPTPDPAILAIARALARQAAREDHAAEMAAWDARAKAAPQGAGASASNQIQSSVGVETRTED